MQQQSQSRDHLHTPSSEMVGGRRPGLTFPGEVAELVEKEYARASVILEYGSGGSTVLATEMSGKTVFSVESDAAWLQNIREWAGANPTGSILVLHHGNIGRTGDWGFPARHAKLTPWRYLGYANSVWRRPDFIHPDVVLIDGRFRVGCFLAVQSRIKRETTVLFDDYLPRPRYRYVERIAKPIMTVESMAVFRLRPRNGRLATWPPTLWAALWPE